MDFLVKEQIHHIRSVSILFICVATTLLTHSTTERLQYVSQSEL